MDKSPSQKKPRLEPHSSHRDVETSNRSRSRKKVVQSIHTRAKLRPTPAKVTEYGISVDSQSRSTSPSSTLTTQDALREVATPNSKKRKRRVLNVLRLQVRHRQDRQDDASSEKAREFSNHVEQTVALHAKSRKRRKLVNRNNCRDSQWIQTQEHRQPVMSSAGSKNKMRNYQGRSDAVVHGHTLKPAETDKNPSNRKRTFCGDFSGWLKDRLREREEERKPRPLPP